MRILVVDDNEDHLNVLMKTLHMYGSDVRGSKDGHAAMDIAIQWEPQLVLCDVMLKGMHAWRFAFNYLRYLRNSSGLDNPPSRPYFVALADRKNDVLQESLCMEHGFDIYILKPLDLYEMLSWVKKAIEKQEIQ